MTTMAMILSLLVGRGTLETALGLTSTDLLDGWCLKDFKLSTRLAGCGFYLALRPGQSAVEPALATPLSWRADPTTKALAGGWQWHGLVVRVLEGTIISMRPHGRIPQRFPAHSNQYCSCYWWPDTDTRLHVSEHERHPCACNRKRGGQRAGSNSQTYLVRLCQPAPGAPG